MLSALLTPTIAAATLVVGRLTYVSIEPNNAFWGPVRFRGEAAGANRYALTFDDGPTPGGTDRMLDVLAAANVHAAFFVIGCNVEKHPGLLRRIDEEGHLIANHTWSHSHYGVMRRDRFWCDQVARTDAIIEQTIGRRPALFRPPLGIRTWHTYAACRACDKTLVTWRRRAIDGSRRSSKERVLRRLGPTTQPGDILLLHDGVEPNAWRDPAPTVAAVGPLIAQLRERGLEPARLDAVLGLPAYLDAATPVG